MPIKSKRCKIKYYNAVSRFVLQYIEFIYDEIYRNKVRHNLLVCATCILSKCLSVYPREWKRSLCRNERSMTRPFCTKRWTAVRIDISPLSWAEIAQRTNLEVKYALKADDEIVTKFSIFIPLFFIGSTKQIRHGALRLKI